jgi:hypothetical protein
LVNSGDRGDGVRLMLREKLRRVERHREWVANA